MAALYSELPYYLRIMRVAVGRAATQLPPNVSGPLQANSKIIDLLNDLAKVLDNRIDYRALLITRGYATIQDHVMESVPSSIPGAEKLKKELTVRLDRIFAPYTKHVNEIRSQLGAVIKAIKILVNKWDTKYNGLLKDLNEAARTSGSPQEKKKRVTEINVKIREMKVNTKSLDNAIRVTLPLYLDEVEKGFNSLLKISEEDKGDSLNSEIAKRERELASNRKEVQKEEKKVESLKEKASRSQKAKTRYEEKSGKLKLYRGVMKANVAYVSSLKELRSNKELTIGLREKVEEAKEDLKKVRASLSDLASHLEVPKPVPSSPMRPPALPTKNDSKAAPSPSPRRNPPKRFTRPRMSSAQKRLRKAAKRLLIIDYLRHKSL